MEPAKSLELKKHVATIHSSHKLSLVQRKIANALLFNAYDDLLAKDEHQIHIKTLCNLIGYDSHDYKTIKKALVNLLSTVIEWNLVDGDKVAGEGVWNASSIIADASIDGPICTYSYSNKMKKLLYTPELYGRLNMVVQAKFQSTYGLALYENCIRYQNIDQTPWFDIAKFRKLMGVEEGKYAIFRDFKRRVLDKAIDEVNKFSSIHVTSHFQRKGRQVTAIQFSLQLASKRTQTNTEKTQPLSHTLKEFGFSPKQIEETLTNFDEMFINEKIELIINSSSYAKGKIGNLAKYLLHALAGDYQQPKRQLKVKLKVESNDKSTEKDKLVNNRRAEDKFILDNFLALSTKDRKKTLNKFQKYLGKSLYRDIYLRDGLENVLVRDQLCEFLRTHHHKEVDDQSEKLS